MEHILKKRTFTYLKPAQIRPQGWLKRQLELQAQGLSGHLDKIWPDIRDSKWIGGDREGWERVPYWLDGFIPLAWLLDDEDLKARAKKYVDAILERQQEDGWICPCGLKEREDYDVWAAFLICKVLTVYADCSGDDRIEQAVYDVLKQLLSHIACKSLFRWGSARWFECLIPLWWLYERRPESWMIDLAYVLEGYGMDYEKMYHALSFERPKAQRYWTFSNHVVNVAMALKSRAEMSRITGEDPDAFARFFYDRLMKEHGMPIGHFTGDECLSGTSPLQGSECCSVVEAMYSYEELLSIGGNPYWGDVLEQVAYNGLAATVSADMWTHQYVQMTNQVECSLLPEEKIPFNSNGADAHNFGLEPNFGCCTANFNQGWPKLALSGVMASKDGLVITVLEPLQVTAVIQGVEVELTVDTQYPFRDQVRIGVKTKEPVAFTLAVRLPGFAESARIRTGEGTFAGTPGSFYEIHKIWSEAETLEVSFSFAVKFADRPSGMKVLKRGPLVYALPVAARYVKEEYVRDGVERKFPYCDYRIYPTEEWAFGFGNGQIAVQYADMPDMPFDREHPPVMLEAEMVPLEWKKEGGLCAEKPESVSPAGQPVKKRLYPYGCTTLRMTELPQA